MLTTDTDDLTLLADCRQLKGVGDKLYEKLNKLDIFCIKDLLFHLPLRYQDKTRQFAIKDAEIGDEGWICGTVADKNIHYGRQRSLLITLTDEKAFLRLRFFNFGRGILSQFSVGDTIWAFGEVKQMGVHRELMHPEISTENPLAAPTQSQTLTPIYPTTKGLNQGTLFKLTTEALKRLDDHHLSELLPPSMLSHLPTLKQSLNYVHRPPTHAPVAQLMEGNHLTQQRLILEELVAHQLALKKMRTPEPDAKAPTLSLKSDKLAAFIQTFGFTLTAAQQRVVDEIGQDIKKTLPMNRLVQGDVGCGKTVVAAIQLYIAVKNNYQAAIMAPTEILATQHFEKMQTWFKPLGICVALLTGKLSQKEKRHALERIALGVTEIVVGTHALIQEAVIFKNLALVIIDEQHRFGVNQRHLLKQKGENNAFRPHQLTMTATPIPRTLSMATFDNLSLSTIDELPPGRTPINTVLVSSEKRSVIIERIKLALNKGDQAYWICPLIEESEVLNCEAAEKTCETLKTLIPNINIGLIHGRLPGYQKEAMMTEFLQGHIQLLVATTVIEVGVDVPNASLMIIENPERLGLAQLHQLRGRVGRGSKKSFCILLYQAPLSKVAALRLNIMRESTDGFYIAEKDLEIRGPGMFLGTQQTGVGQYKIANLLRDKNLLGKAQQISKAIMTSHAHLSTLLINRWVGTKEKYGDV